MLTRKIRQKIDTSVLCWLATAAKDGTPNVSPKELFTHYDGRFLLIANIASPQSIKNVQENPVVCVSFIDVFIQKGYQLKGTASVISKKEKDFASLAKPLKKMAGDLFPFTQIIKLEINAVKPIIAPRYLLYQDTTEEDQAERAMQSYGVRPL